MKKDNTLLWVGVGTLVVVGVVLYFVLKPKKGDKKDDKNDDATIEPEVDPNTGKIQYGSATIDPTKFKIDLDKVMNILKAPVSKEQKYANMKTSGLSDNIINMVKNQDDLAEKKKLSDIIGRIRQQEMDAEFQKKFGVKPIKLPTYGLK
jgi:hypothetical protein